MVASRRWAKKRVGVARLSRSEGGEPITDASASSRDMLMTEFGPFCRNI